MNPEPHPVSSPSKAVDVLAVMDELVSFEERMAEAEPRANHEAREARSVVAEVLAVANLIVDGAMPATASGATCFVPRYQIDRLRAALSTIGESQDVR